MVNSWSISGNSCKKIISAIRLNPLLERICVYLCYLWEIIRVIRVIRVLKKIHVINVICGRVICGRLRSESVRLTKKLSPHSSEVTACIRSDE